MPRPDARVPPHDLDAERGLLSAMLTNRDACWDAQSRVTAEDFYGSGHPDLFRLILEAYAAGDDRSPAAIAARAASAGVGERWTKAAVMALLAEPPSVVPATLAEVVAERAARRRIIAATMDLTAGAYDVARDLATLERDARASLDRAGVPSATPDTALDFVDLIHRDTTEDWLVPDLFERGDRMMLTGPEGFGKSTIIQQMAVQMAAGVHPFTLAAIPPVRVLVLDLENTERQVARKYRRLAGSLARAHLKMERGFLSTRSIPAGLDMRDPRAERMVAGLIAEHEAQVLCIGPVYKAYRAHGRETKFDETAAEEFALAIDRLRAAFGVVVLMEAHAPHGEGGNRANWRPYGASLWMRWPEFGFGLKPLNEDATEVEIVAWRGERERGRAWPKRMVWGQRWLWEVAEWRAGFTPPAAGGGHHQGAMDDDTF